MAQRLPVGLASLGAALILVSLAIPAEAQGNRCNDEAGSIQRAESQLPRLDVAPPADRQIVCITLETNIVFARRLATHIKNCPQSPYTRTAEVWQRTEAQYVSLFAERRCKPAIRGYRG